MRMEDRYDEVVAGLYAAALEPARWHPALMEMAGVVGADTFHFLTWDRHDVTSAFDLYSHEWMAAKVVDYAAHYGAIDPRRRLLESLPVGRTIGCHQHFSEAAVARDEFFQEFLIPGGLRHTAMARMQDDDQRYTLIGLMREVGHRSFDDVELALAQRVVGHLDRACRLWNETQQQQLTAAVDSQAVQASGLALLAVNADGRIVHANAQAERALADGRCLAGRNGRVGAARADDDARLRELLREVHASGCGASLALADKHDARGGLLVQVVPLVAGRGEWAGARVLITARARRRPGHLSVLALADTFGLSPAESAVALALCEGKTLDEHARSCGVSVATVRTQLRSVFDKTGTRRQADTVRLLLAMPPENG